MTADVHGHCAPGFEPVRAVFEGNLAQAEVGASCCVYRHGEPVVDLWGGRADAASGRPWERDTVALVFSSSKGVTALLVHRLVEQGALELDAPVARWWPEFAANGKGAITLRDVMTHRAGLAAVDAELTLDEVLAWHPVCEAIAAQAPNWTPREAPHGYHARSFGWILGELVRRAAGVSIGALLARDVAGPLGLDLWIGLPEAVRPRLAPIVPAPLPTAPDAVAARERFMGPGTLTGRVLSGPSGLFSYGDMWNDPALLAAEMPSTNGVGNARSLARLYAATIGEVDGVRLLAPATLAAATEPQVEGRDRVLKLPTRFGSGFMLPPALGPKLPATAFGHPGAGGSLGFADPARGIAFGYVMNRMQLGILGDARSRRLTAAVYASAAKRRAQ